MDLNPRQRRIAMFAVIGAVIVGLLCCCAVACTPLGSQSGVEVDFDRKKKRR